MGHDGSVVKLFLCGDVMLGRGIDQILPHPGDPALQERYVGDARDYVELAERVSGPIPSPVDFAWPWGEVLPTLDDEAPDVRIINLETAVTRSDDFAPGKGIHYRMHPDNLPCLTAVDPDVCVLANNHALDLGRSGLVETLDVLSDAQLRVAGAGRDLAEAQRPTEVSAGDEGRVLTFAVGIGSSGVPGSWAAGTDRSGLDFLDRASPDTAAGLIDRVQRHRRRGDLVVVSLHWGSNWGYRIPDEQVRFAQALIDGGVDVVHGHSSHHPRPVEVYENRLILYGCGDLINDYEGISGHEEYRDDLRPIYLADVEDSTGELTALHIVPFQARKMRLERVSEEDRDWLRDTLDRISRPHGCRIVHADRGLAVERA